MINNFKRKLPKKFIQIGSSIEYGKRKSPQKESLLKKLILFQYMGMQNLKVHYSYYQFLKKKIPVSIIRLYLVYGPNQDNNRVIPFVINNSLRGNKFNCSPGFQFRIFYI